MAQLQPDFAANPDHESIFQINTAHHITIMQKTKFTKYVLFSDSLLVFKFFVFFGLDFCRES